MITSPHIQLMDTLWTKTFNAKTQKARGLVSFINSKLHDKFSHYSLESIVHKNRFIVITDQQTMDSINAAGELFFSDLQYRMGNIFARPCPMTPQHGFVDSREVKTLEELNAIWKETIAVDPHGELILCSQIAAEYNFILTPNSCTMGKGHDGATSGKDAIVYPLVDGWTKWISSEAGIVNTPYVEAVADSTYTYITQLRDGPELPKNAIDYNPVETLVRSIIIVENQDLLEWQAIINKIAPDSGTIVYHKGGSMACHYAIHCILNKIPYITSFEPHIGDVIAPIESTTGLNLNHVVEGLRLSLSRNVNIRLKTALAQKHLQSAAVYAMLYILHNFAVLGRTESRFFGFVLGLTLRCSIAACLGELRHHRGVKGEGDRDKVYKKYISNLDGALDKINIAYNVFKDGNWPSGYGGKSWANCAKQTILFHNHIVRLLRSPTQLRLNKLVASLNTLVNTAHNNGNFLNKYVQTQTFDVAAMNQAIYFLVNASRIEMVRVLLTEFTADVTYRPVRTKGIRFKPSKQERAVIEQINITEQDSYDKHRRTCNDCGSEWCSACNKCHNCESKESD